ncbi:anti-sigma regulatory factor (Ser/Thr protein kinase) [Streptomyces sp. B4I13]|uniref:ATP-binding protein n=1 Tax=Streptomyces sp. B4I13 TaxID=3042271 RepID=UPI002785DCE1|nr:ATP-binding protein [Streptomyces sp. B4I13]MDQ0964057.1 anti-sigma regulatory factor (Ser/Thr protein kinase) [Streptomyces sp. B4I13]
MREDELASARPPRARARARHGAQVQAPVATAAAARAHARAVAEAGWDPATRPAHETDMIDLLLVVSELVTNALRHGGGLAGFEAVAGPDGIRLAVRDHSDEVPSGVCGPAPPPSGRATGGYGWPLVLRLAREVDIEKEPAGGKTIRVFMPVRTAGEPL